MDIKPAPTRGEAGTITLHKEGCGTRCCKGRRAEGVSLVRDGSDEGRMNVKSSSWLKCKLAVSADEQSRLTCIIVESIVEAPHKQYEEEKGKMKTEKTEVEVRGRKRWGETDRGRRTYK